MSRILKESVSAALFTALTIKLDELSRGDLDVTPTGYKKDYELLKTSGCFGLIKHLHLKSPFHQKFSYRYCNHLTHLWSNSNPTGLMKLERRLKPLLEQVEEHSLQSFR